MDEKTLRDKIKEIEYELSGTDKETQNNLTDMELIVNCLEGLATKIDVLSQHTHSII